MVQNLDYSVYPSLGWWHNSMLGFPKPFTLAPNMEKEALRNENGMSPPPYNMSLSKG